MPITSLIKRSEHLKKNVLQGKMFDKGTLPL